VPRRDQHFLKKSKANKFNNENFTNFMLKNVIQDTLPVAVDNKTINTKDFLSKNGISLKVSDSKEQTTGNTLNFLNRNGIKIGGDENSEESEMQSTIVDDNEIE